MTRILLFGATLLAFAAFLYYVYGRKEPEAAVQAAPDTTLGAAPPPDVGRNAKAARDFSTRQVCLANCAAEERTCSATASDRAATAACAQAKDACEAACPSDAR